MLTTFCNGNLEKIKEICITLKEGLEKRGIHVLRTKIESMAHNKGVPDVAEGSHYVEFHFKVDVSNSSEWQEVANVCARRGAHLFFNPYSRTGTMRPVVTLRRYNVEIKNAEKEAMDLAKELTRSRIKDQEKEIQMEREYSVFDSNVYLDEGWLFEYDVKNFLTTAQNINESIC